MRQIRLGLPLGAAPRISRRRALVGVAAASALAALGWAGRSAVSGDRPLALVYRGPAACSGCAEAVAALLRSSPAGFRTEYCGPHEQRQISSDAFAEAAVYAQPGGGDVRPAWRKLRDYAELIRGFVGDGGHYLGFCLGAYLAAADTGFGLIRGEVDQYISTDGASVDSTDDTVIPVRWRGRVRHMYFQDGPTFKLRPGVPGTVLATYDTGAAAAVVTTFGAGRVGLVGPHPEADRSWYADAGLTNPDGIRFDLGHDLIKRTMDGDGQAISKS
ncbi:BPL-N domain-containing protein [Micromonospora phytophila]|uniref:BPL-N domain-containing protein n=1 Tax=Micromonospora phytophila TaxID=709888 RepID=UPI00202E19C5|nr:BPL-N domain-containing protein [Micromonospora phytophila]MCM0674795.1 BPL-N domain-containing protein [Micromonospora phytophila]